MKKKYPAQIRIISHDVVNGYPKGGMSIEGGERFPSGIYREAHAAQYLVQEGWPPNTHVLFRVEGRPCDSFKPMTIGQAAAVADKELSQKPKKAPWAGAAPAVAAKAPKARPAASSGKPAAGSKLAAVWDLLDSMLAASGEVPTVKLAKEAGAVKGLNPGTIGVQYGKWKKRQAAQ